MNEQTFGIFVGRIEFYFFNPYSDGRPSVSGQELDSVATAVNKLTGALPLEDPLVLDLDALELDVVLQPAACVGGLIMAKVISTPAVRIARVFQGMICFLPSTGGRQ